MFLTTSHAALTGSSITALSQAITTINHNNNNINNTSSTPSGSNPAASTSSTSLHPSSVSSAFKSKFTKSRREHALTARSNTSTSINSVNSAASSNVSSNNTSSAARSTSVAASTASSVSSVTSPSIPNNNNTPLILSPTLSAETTPPVTSPGGNSLQDPFEKVEIICDPVVPLIQRPESISLDNTTDETSSMRRRATETLGSNLIPSSLRAVFRDNNTTAAAPTDNITTSNSSDQPPADQIASLRLEDAPVTQSQPIASSPPSAAGRMANANAAEMPSIKFIPHQDQRASRPSLAFAPMTRTLPDGTSVIRVGRYSERDQSPNANNTPSSAPIGFKSKVVSRRHCEFWCSNGQWYVKDVKSSSGTFLNHIRLSQPSTESKPFPINDGDIVQLGMDFRGGEESIFRCVKIRIEVNRGWQKKLNDFNTTTHKALRALSKETSPTSSTECSICLMSVSPCQALFVAPCSHVWHYKCIRPVINNPKMYPQFLCPNCRAVTDLEADIEENVDGWDESELLDHDATTGEVVGNRASTPVNAHENGEDTQVNHPTGQQQTAQNLSVPTVQEISANQATTSNNDSGSNEEVQDPTMLFTEPSAIQIRDPRAIAESLEGVLTPRNEAGPFVFDGSGRRVDAPVASS